MPELAEKTAQKISPRCVRICIENLEAKKDELEKRLEDLKKTEVPQPERGYFGGAITCETLNMVDVWSRNFKGEIKRIEFRIKQLKENTFNRFCNSCKQPLNGAEFEADPRRTLCTECQRKANGSRR